MLITGSEMSEGAAIILFSWMPFLVIALIVATLWYMLKVASRFSTRAKKLISWLENEER
jgi:sensor histidine kinase YesM